MKPTSKYKNEYIPTELWGRDHWSCLAYIETRIVDGGFVMKFDPRMRQNRRHFRVLGGASGKLSHNGIPMSSEYGSRLSDGTYAENHDDWNCVQDFAAAGLLEQSPENIDVGRKISLSEKGWHYTHLLREHKASGGSFGDFKYLQESHA